MSIEKVLEAVTANRSLWVELECPSLVIDDQWPMWPGLPPQPVTDPMHCTLTFFGKGSSIDFVQGLFKFLSDLKPSMFESRISGLARFRGNMTEGDPVVLLLSDPRIRELKQQINYVFPTKKNDWDYTPHITLARIP